MRRRIRDADDQPQKEEDEQEKNTESFRGSGAPSAKREGGVREQQRRWGYMTPFSDNRFSLSPEDWFKDFDEMRHEMEHVFEQTVQDIERIPKELVREYQTSTGGMAREIGPLVYGYSYTVGADGKPQFREFGNVRPSQSSLKGGRPRVGEPMLTAEREPLADITIMDKEVKVTVEMPGISKQEIKVSAYGGAVEVFTTDKAKRKYHRIINLPSETNIETARSTYSNGILEIIFQKKTPSRGREIKID
jgi:HSP20 family protein